MDAPRCSWEDCGGAIDEDGFCVVCGHDASVAAPPPPFPPGPPPPRQSSVSLGVPCRVPGCTGSVEAGGLCDESGHPQPSVEDTTVDHRPPYRRLHSAPPVDPSQTLWDDPVLPRPFHLCPNKHCPSRRERRRLPGVSGYCTDCGTRYNFTPSLAGGDMIDRYEVRGVLGHGGKGWIYLCSDTNLDDNLVAVKAMINDRDAAAVEEMRWEKQLLVAVDHPGIVTILDFVVDSDPRTRAPSGYLVEEYVPGYSLGQLRPVFAGADRTPSPLDPLRAMLEVLDVFSYLHSIGIVYCDLKPDNVMQVDKAVKVIDLGAAVVSARAPLDTGGSVAANDRFQVTPGYCHPEVEVGARSPDAWDDLFTVGRTLASLALPGFDVRADTPDPSGSLAHPLPSERPSGVDTSLFYFLRRACSVDRSRQFASAGEMAGQMEGVLRQVYSAREREPVAARSRSFRPPRDTFGTRISPVRSRLLQAGSVGEMVRFLPVPRPAESDPAAAALDWMNLLPADRALDPVTTLAADRPDSREARFARVRVSIEAGTADRRAVREELEALRSAAPPHPTAAGPGYDWRCDWYEALLDFGEERADPLLERVRHWLPGELAPIMARAARAELRGDVRAAVEGYVRVWRSDPTYTAAAFGTARLSHDDDERIAALEAIPGSSSDFTAAREALTVFYTRRTEPGLDDLAAAAAHFADLRHLDSSRRRLCRADIWRAALEFLDREGDRPGEELLGVPLRRRDVALAYDSVLREVGREMERDHRHQVVAFANTVRPRTWW
ncbi:tetratricopeptide repeat protein [Salininema proteolyticum]|uniref:non-specific serine/threonine protein kinase n=1 Tax=Salininema proteolyticum TaxID=1607685 RepID=A0ABV8TZ31_9ACTN